MTPKKDTVCHCGAFPYIHVHESIKETRKRKMCSHSEKEKELERYAMVIQHPCGHWVDSVMSFCTVCQDKNTIKELRAKLSSSAGALGSGFEETAKLTPSPATLGDILEIIEDYCEGPYPVSKDGKNANGKTYLDFATALLKKVGV